MWAASLAAQTDKNGEMTYMEMTKYSCEEFVDILASKEPIPGGGGAASLVGAIGAALGDMVCSLTVGKKKYADVQEEILALKDEYASLEKELLNLVSEDAKVFEPLSKAYGLPKETEEEKAYKEKVMEEVLKEACGVPIKIMESCCKAIGLVKRTAEIGTAIAISDAGCAAACLRGALMSASLNVFINTKSMKNREYAESLENHANEMINTYAPMCDEIFNLVLEKIK